MDRAEVKEVDVIAECQKSKRQTDILFYFNWQGQL